ncbi:MAG: hypothetical protein ABI723_23385, partial [Bacteroidia bacterium]
MNTQLFSSDKIFFKIIKRITFLLMIMSTIYVNGQTARTAKWTERSSNRNATFYEVQKDFYKQWKSKLKEMAREKRKGKTEGEENEAGGYEVYKRWESYMAPRVYPSGDLSLPSNNYANFIAWQQSLPLNKGGGVASTFTTGNWTELGPVGSPSGPSPYSRTGAGRTNFLRFDPNNSNTMYVGAPDGGLWKSTNSGTTWTTNTDFLTVIGVSDLCIDPTNTQIMYLATGDLEGNRRSAGVFKSTDGGATWNTTGVSWTPTDNYKISKMLMNPSNPLNMIISTDGGTFRTTDGWVSSTQGNFPVGSPDLKDMEFKPGDANTIYAAGNKFFKSTDNGVNWTQITTGLPSSNIERIALGVSPGNAAYVYALIGKSSDQSFLGMYRSINSGTSFSLRSSSPNLLGYETDGLDNGGQAFYDLAVAVSPTNAELVTTGGVNHWQSANGGTTWVNKSYWAAGQVHADIHEISYLPGSSTTLFSCNDGGLFKSIDNGTNWTDISNNLAIAQVVGLGLSQTVATSVVAGMQDNGTNLKTGSSWANIFGGDGGDCFLNYTNNDTIFIQYVQGAFSRSDDGGASTNSITSGLPGGFDFYSNWKQDPINPNKLYVGGVSTLYGSSDKGDNWSALGTPSGSGTVKNLAIAPSNNTVIYVVKDDAVSKSTNSGASFTNITGTLPVGSAALISVTVSNTNSNKVWVTFSGYSAANKVFQSTNGGTSWTNISTGLPNLPMNDLVYNNGSASDAIYVAADIGVYYFDNTLSAWAPFMTSLPNVSVRELEIYYPTGKIRAATYGRGVWESDLNSSVGLTSITTSPISPLIFCSGVGSPVNVSFTIDAPANAGNIFTAQLSDASGSFASPVNIGTLTSTTAGIISATIPNTTPVGGGYRIRVVSSNPVVTGSDNGTNISVNASPVPVITGSTSFCAGSSTTLNAGVFSSYSWSTGATTQTISVNTAGTFTVTVTNGSGCTGSASATTTVNANPTPVITGSTSFCAGSSTTLNAGVFSS